MVNRTGIIVVDLAAAKAESVVGATICDPSANQIGRQLGQPVVLILGPAVRDGEILALNIADFFRALAECAQMVRL
jgi:hypothetical protein